MGRFDGRKVIVTGGSSGIGRAAVHQFVDEGAAVVAVGRSQEKLDAVRSDASASDQVTTIAADLTSAAAVRDMVDEGISALGGLDVLVNNAGVAFLESLFEITEETWNQTVATNLSAPFWASQRAARHMADNGGGAIVNVASTDAFVAESPLAHYNASKAALVLLTQSFAHELGHLGIRCNCVAPGLTDTPMLEDDLDSAEF